MGHPALIHGFTLAIITISVWGCAWSSSGLAKPVGHSNIAVDEYAPGVPYLDAGGKAWQLARLSDGNWTYPRYIANMSALYGVELCYWSQQVLPSPPTGLQPDGSCAPSPCTWAAPTLDDATALVALGSQASARMTHLDQAPASPLLGSQCGGGYENARVLCAADPISSKCAPAVLNQHSQWAVASNVIKLTLATLHAVIDNITMWRSLEAWHVPAMASELTAKGWGFGGAITAKLFRCSAIPQTYLTQASDCDTLEVSGTSTLYDAAFQFWSTYVLSTDLKLSLGLDSEVAEEALRKLQGVTT